MSWIVSVAEPLVASGTVGVSKGVTGLWTVKVVFNNYSGPAVNFRVQKAP